MQNVLLGRMDSSVVGQSATTEYFSIGQQSNWNNLQIPYRFCSHDITMDDFAATHRLRSIAPSSSQTRRENFARQSNVIRVN